MLQALTENNVLFYDEDKYDSFLHNVFYGATTTTSTSDNHFPTATATTTTNSTTHIDSNTNVMASTATTANDRTTTSTDNSSIDSEDPTMICNVGILLNNINKWRQQLPNVGLYYKVNANCDLVLLRILNAYNVKFSVLTATEMSRLLTIDVQPSSIIYSASCYFSRHIRDASLHGIHYITVHSVSSLERVHSCWSNVKLLIKLYNNNNINKNLNIINNIVKRAIELNTTIIDGFHVDMSDNSNNNNINYNQLFQQLSYYINYINQHYNTIITIKYINIGNQIPTYSSKQFLHFKCAINEFIQQHPTIEIVAEPGNFLVETANQLCCNVVGIRGVQNISSGESIMFYYLNDGLYGSLSNIYYRNYKPIVEILKKEGFKTQDNNPCNTVTSSNTTFWGPTCDSMDKICSLENFPLLSIGDTVLFKNIGLYNMACATNFNGFNLPKSKYIVSYQQLQSLGIVDITLKNE